MKRVSKWLVLTLVAGGIFVGDQLSKYWAVANLTNLFERMRAEGLGERVHAWIHETHLLERGLSQPPIEVVHSFWQFLYTQNPGAAFSFLAGAGESVRVPFFHAMTLGAVILIGWYYRKLAQEQRFMQVAWALVLGGALGNGLDRLLRGYVIDFIDWHLNDAQWLHPSHHWPTFNVADCGISVGIVLLLLHGFLVREDAHKQAQRNEQPQAKSA